VEADNENAEARADREEHDATHRVYGPRFLGKGDLGETVTLVVLMKAAPERDSEHEDHQEHVEPDPDGGPEVELAHTRIPRCEFAPTFINTQLGPTDLVAN
jgi:hypothetical protein